LSDEADCARLVAAIPVGVVRVVEGRIAFANEAAALIFGEPAAALVGRALLDFVDPAEREVVASRNKQRMRGERAPERYVVTHVRRDGVRRRVEVQPIATGPKEAVSVLRDVSDEVLPSALVVALTELAAHVQVARSVRAVFDVAGQGLLGLGMSAFGGRLEGDEIVIASVSWPPDAGHSLETLLGRPLAGLRFAKDLVPGVAMILETRRSQYYEDVGPAIAAVLENFGVPPATRLPRDTDRMLLAPLVVRDRPWGALAVTSPTLSVDDAAALTLFAAQISSTLEVLESLADLERTNRDIAAIHAVARTTGDAQLGDHLPRLAGIAATASASDLAALMLVDEPGDAFVLAALHGFEGEVPPSIRRVPRTGSVTGAVAAAGKPCALSRADLPEGAALDLVAAQGIEHAVILPLSLQDRLVGVLMLARREPRPYRPEDVGAATILASQLAIQVENFRLGAEAQRRVAMLQVLFELGRVASEVHEVAPLAERVVLLLGEAMSVDGARLYLAESGGERLALGSWRETGESSVALGGLPVDESTLVGRVALHRRTEVLDWRRTTPGPGAVDVVRHEVAAPLVAGDRLVGVLSLLRRSERPFLEEEVRLLEASAGQTALAIERARLYEGAQRRVEELQLLLDVGRVITASLDLEEVLEKAAGILARFVDASSGYILLLDPARPVLLGAACSNAQHRAHWRTVQISLDEPSIAADAVRSRVPVAVLDATSSTRVATHIVSRYGSKSLLALPLLVRDQPIGCVVLDDVRAPRRWTDAEIQRASLIVNQVGVAVSNARLYEDLKKSYGELACAQEELVKRERLAALGELAAVVAHEVRNPVAVIFNALSALRKILKLTGDAAMLLGIVGEEADRLNRIVGDLLDFARPSEPALAPEPLDLVIRDTVEAAAHEPAATPVQIRTEIQPDLPEVRLDARMVRRALLNVVVNGLQAMPRGGVLTVAAATDVSGGKRWARVDVQDTGPGVPPDVLGKIFQPFFTTKTTGTGLGLAVVKRIMEAHHGEVLVESRAGEGTKVSLLLPLDDDA
jgi:PAS domain S-box-containing protein